MMSDEKVCVGAIGGSYGVKGELRIKSFCAQAEDIESYSPLSNEDGTAQYHLALIRPIKNGFAARITEVTTKEQADDLRAVKLFANRTQLPSLPEDEYYHADLIGLSVFDTGGALVGTVKAVQNHGAADLLEVQKPATSVTVLLPFTLAAVPTVDLGTGRIIVDPPEGAL